MPHTPPQIRLNFKFKVWDKRIAERKTTISFVPRSSDYSLPTQEELYIMAGSLDYAKICGSCPSGDGWGPSVTTETTLDGVPYAPFSKGDKLGRMADWTTEGKDRDRGGRNQYNRTYRGW